MSIHKLPIFLLALGLAVTGSIVARAADAPSPPTTAAPSEHKFTDAEIFGVLKAINDATIEESRVAEPLVTHHGLKRFAKHLVTQHTAANKREAALHERHRVQLAESGLSGQIKAKSQQKVHDLKNTSKGPAFDRAYIDAQIQFNTEAIDSIDRKLLPNAQGEHLRKELHTLRAALEADLKEARNHLESLEQPKHK